MKEMRYFGRYFITMALVLSFFLVSGISTKAFGEEEIWPPPLGKEKIIILQPPWGSGLTMTFTNKILLEKMGYKVELKLADTGLAYTALAGGTADLWCPGYFPAQNPFLEKVKGKVTLLGMSLTDLVDGLCVPDYVDISTMEELKKPEVKKLLGGKIIGHEAGTGSMMKIERALKAYGLDYEIVYSSTPAMSAVFRSAYAKREPVLVAGWCPTDLCAEYNLKFLKDTKGIFTATFDFYVVRKGFRTDFPRATALLSRVTFYNKQMSDLVISLKGRTPEENCRLFIEQNPELVYFWAGDLIPNYEMPKSIPK